MHQTAVFYKISGVQKLQICGQRHKTVPKGTSRDNQSHKHDQPGYKNNEI